MKTVKIGYSATIVVPEHLLASFIGMLSACKILEGYNLKKEVKGLSFTVEEEPDFLKNPVSERERVAIQELEEKNIAWAAAYNKANALEKELKELKGNA